MIIKSSLKKMNDFEKSLLDEFKKIKKDLNPYKYAEHLEELKDYYLLTNHVGYKILCTKDKKHSTGWGYAIVIGEDYVTVSRHYNPIEKKYFSLNLKNSTRFSIDAEFAKDYILVERDEEIYVYDKNIEVIGIFEIKKCLLKSKAQKAL